MLYLKNNEHSVLIENEESMINGDGAAERRKVFDQTYFLGKSTSSTCAHSVTYGEPGALHKSCLVMGSRSPTKIHSRSGLLREDQCILAVSNFLVALHLPHLSLMWASNVDLASIFGVYHLPQLQGYVVHGELTIARVSYSGEILWSSGGQDIFTGITISDQHIEAIDFNNEKYHIDLEAGRSILVEP